MSLSSLLSSLYHKVLTDNNGQPSLIEKYIGYISLFILYSIWCLSVFVYSKWCKKCCCDSKAPKHAYIPLKDSYNDGNSDRDLDHNIDVNQHMVDGTIKQINIKDMYLKSAYNIFSAISDTMNSFVFIYYFKFYTNYSKQTNIFYIQLVFFITKLLFFIFDIINNVICRKKYLLNHYTFFYDLLKYHICLIAVLYKFWYTMPYIVTVKYPPIYIVDYHKYSDYDWNNWQNDFYFKVTELQTFWMLIFSLTMTVKTGILIPFTYLSRLQKLWNKKFDQQKKKLLNEKVSKIKKWINEQKNKFYQFLGQLLIIIPTFIVISCFGSILMLFGQKYIIFFSVIWIFAPWLIIILLINIKIYTMILLTIIHSLNIISTIYINFIMMCLLIFFGVDHNMIYFKNIIILLPFMCGTFIYLYITFTLIRYQCCQCTYCICQCCRKVSVFDFLFWTIWGLPIWVIIFSGCFYVFLSDKNVIFGLMITTAIYLIFILLILVYLCWKFITLLIAILYEMRWWIFTLLLLGIISVGVYGVFKYAIHR